MALSVQCWLKHPGLPAALSCRPGLSAAGPARIAEPCTFVFMMCTSCASPRQDTMLTWEHFLQHRSKAQLLIEIYPLLFYIIITLLDETASWPLLTSPISKPPQIPVLSRGCRGAARCVLLARRLDVPPSRGLIGPSVLGVPSRGRHAAPVRRTPAAGATGAKWERLDPGGPLRTSRGCSASWGPWASAADSPSRLRSRRGSSAAR